MARTRAGQMPTEPRPAPPAPPVAPEAAAPATPTAPEPSAAPAPAAAPTEPAPSQLAVDRAYLRRQGFTPEQIASIEERAAVRAPEPRRTFAERNFREEPPAAAPPAPVEAPAAEAAPEVAPTAPVAGAAERVTETAPPAPAESQPAPPQGAIQSAGRSSYDADLELIRTTTDQRTKTALAQGLEARMTNDQISGAITPEQWDAELRRLDEVATERHYAEGEAAGAPHNEAAAQATLFGGEEIAGKPQTELLPETAGIPTAKLGQGKITAEETTRLAAERGAAEPPGERPAELPLEQPTTAPTGIVRMPVSEISVDPERFQFKRLGAGGVGSELKGVNKFNEQLAGVTSVWRDPADGRTYVVNGHHRVELAQRLGQRELNVQYIDQPTAERARAEGAFMNIAEGRGSPLDVAKFLRDTRSTPADLEARGVSLRSDLADKGLALSRLAPDLFDATARGDVSEGAGAAIGRLLEDRASQREAFQAVRKSGKRLTDAEVTEVARQVRDAGTEDVGQETLFGSETERRGLYVPRAQIAASLKKRLAGDRRLFGFVTKEGRPKELGRAGATQIDVGAARGLAEKSAQIEELFDRLYTRSGPLADLVTEGARRVARGENPGAVAADIYPTVGESVSAEIARAGGGAQPDVSARRGDAAAGTVAPVGAARGTEGTPPQFVDPNQEGMFPPTAENPERGWAIIPDLSRPKGAAAPGLTEAERVILKHVGEPSKEPGTFLSPLGRLYARLVRGTYALEKAGERAGELPAHRDPGDLAMLAAGSATRAEEFLVGQGPFHWTAEGNVERTGTPSMHAVLGGVAKERGGLDALNAYEVSARALELEARKIRTGFDLGAARKVVDGASPAVKVAHDALVQLRHDARDYWARAGGLSPESVKAMDALNEDYVPFQRVFETGARPGAIGGAGRLAQQVKRIRGSERAVVDPIASTIDQVTRMIAAGDRNRVVDALVDAASEHPAAFRGVAEPETSAARRTVTAQARALQAEAQKVGVTIPDDAAAEITSQLGAQADLAASGGRINLWRNGAPQGWRVDPEIARSLDNLGPGRTPLLVSLLALPARTLKAGITLDPAFGVFNKIRDMFDATIQSRSGFRPVVDDVSAFRKVLQHSPEYAEWRAGGGGFSNTLRGRARSSEAMRRLVIPRSGGGQIVSRLVHPLNALADFARPFEEATRLAEYTRARKAGGSVAAGVRASQEVTVNFQQAGLEMHGLNAMTAFLNPAIQSLDKALRAAGLEAYGETRAAGAGPLEAANVGGAQAAKLMARGVAAISVPSLLFWLANHNDQEITDLRHTPAGLIYWFLRVPGGGIVHIPKPFLWGQVFGTGMESALDDLFAKDPQALDRLASGIWQQAESNIVPTVAQQAIAQYANKVPFFGTPIVSPEQLKTVEPRFQGTAATSRLATILSEAIGRVGEAVGSETLARSISPPRVDQLVRGFGGRLGWYGVRVVSSVIPHEATGASPTTQAPDLPIVGRLFARTPSMGVEPVQRLYDLAGRANEAAGTLRLLEKRGDIDAWQRMAERRSADLLRGPVLNQTVKAIGELRNLQRLIARDPNPSAEEKRAEIDALTRAMVEMAREAVGAAMEAVAPTPAPRGPSRPESIAPALGDALTEAMRRARQRRARAHSTGVTP